MIKLLNFYIVRFFSALVFVFLCSGVFVLPTQANSLPDADRDGVPDKDEIEVYFTDPNNPDTDGDGFSDWIELNQGYSPHNKGAIKLEDADTDKDGLSDRLELNFHTNLIKADTDGDGFSDGDEVENGYDPLNSEKVKLEKKIEVDIKQQKLYYFLSDVRLGVFPVSTGKPSMPTPKGHFQIDNKALRAWSSWGLWMPYWMSLKNGYFGLHELPEWPNGAKEGEDHLGKPVSHGCVRLGVGPAEFIYNWAPIGTKVYIY